MNRLRGRRGAKVRVEKRLEPSRRRGDSAAGSPARPVRPRTSRRGCKSACRPLRRPGKRRIFQRAGRTHGKIHCCGCGAGDRTRANLKSPAASPISSLPSAVTTSTRSGRSSRTLRRRGDSRKGSRTAINLVATPLRRAMANGTGTVRSWPRPLPSTTVVPTSPSRWRRRPLPCWANVASHAVAVATACGSARCWHPSVAGNAAYEPSASDEVPRPAL